MKKKNLIKSFIGAFKKLWNRFRRWAIVKLGGYIEGPHTVRTTVVHPVKLQFTEKCTDDKMYFEDPAYKEYIHRALLNKLVDYLHENAEGLVNVMESHNPMNREVRLLAEINIVPHK